MEDRIIVIEKGANGVGLAQVFLESPNLGSIVQTWQWARMEPSFVEEDRFPPPGTTQYLWAEWEPGPEDYELNIRLLLDLFRKAPCDTMEQALRLAGMRAMGDLEKEQDRAYNAAHLLAALLNGELT